MLDKRGDAPLTTFFPWILNRVYPAIVHRSKLEELATAPVSPLYPLLLNAYDA